MANEVYEVHTNLSPSQLTELAVETYKAWLQFAMGKQAIGGKVLKHPSGQYAAALSWRRTGATSIAIIADESVPQVGWIEYGRAAADIKAAMLADAKVSKDGHRYRVIPVSREPAKMWATTRPFITISDKKPGSWIVPAMPAYSPGAILADLLRENFGT